MPGILGLIVVAIFAVVLFAPRVSRRLHRVMRAEAAAVPRAEVQPSPVMTGPYAYDNCLTGEVKT